MGKLMECGAVNNSRKKFYRNRSIAAFSWGSQALYDYIDDNPMVELLPVHYVNDPFNIAKNENMVSVNTALEIDLTGQICSETLNGKQYSGTGGAWDFAYGAYHAKNGRGIIALQSTAKNGTISRIVPQLSPGSVVSIPRNIVDTVVTEYGIAHLRGKSIRQRVEELIAVAHPDFRAELRAQANKLQIW
jgi:acyl-CoA hydrolase